MRPALAAPLLCALSLLVAWALAFHPAGATHWMAEKWTWWDLTPSGDRHIVYARCPADVPEWAQGVENWDVSMANLMDFDEVACAPVDTVLSWELEGTTYQCPEPPPGWIYYACWNYIGWYDHGNWRELVRADIYFVQSAYSGVSPAWKAAISAHEWGHNLNLADHSEGTQCDLGLLMGLVDPARQPCLTGPSAAEADSVARFYGYWGPDDPDEDGFSNDVENYVDTDPRDNCPDNATDDAWPLDINKDGVITVGGDVLNYRGRIGASPGSPNWWQRLDLNADGIINVGGDVLLYRGMIGRICTNP